MISVMCCAYGDNSYSDIQQTHLQIDINVTHNWCRLPIIVIVLKSMVQKTDLRDCIIDSTMTEEVLSGNNERHCTM